MKTTKINESEIANLKVSSLPTRPTMPSQYGGKGYTASDMKAAFDLLPLFIIEKFNTLIEDIEAEGEESVAAKINTGIGQIENLYELFRSIESGTLLEVARLRDGESVAYAIAEIKDELAKIKQALGISEANDD